MFTFSQVSTSYLSLLHFVRVYYNLSHADCGLTPFVANVWYQSPFPESTRDILYWNVADICKTKCGLKKTKIHVFTLHGHYAWLLIWVNKLKLNREYLSLFWQSLCEVDAVKSEWRTESENINRFRTFSKKYFKPLVFRNKYCNQWQGTYHPVLNRTRN
jgi:hypothetical protein